MKDELSIQLPKEEDFVAANKRRDKYALTRDQQALEFNAAIVTRQQMEARHKVKCEKCGKEFAAGTTTEITLICPDCKSVG
jgi:hypothetical protein